MYQVSKICDLDRFHEESVYRQQLIVYYLVLHHMHRLRQGGGRQLGTGSSPIHGRPLLPNNFQLETHSELVYYKDRYDQLVREAKNTERRFVRYCHALVPEDQTTPGRHMSYMVTRATAH